MRRLAPGIVLAVFALAVAAPTATAAGPPQPGALWGRWRERRRVSPP